MASDDDLREIVVRALSAQYDVLHLIGRGAMGAVFLAKERLLERVVAVKVLPLDAADDQTSRERFLREARTAARLHHPSIVPLYSFAEAEGTLLYVMGYIDGESLESLLQREIKLDVDRARSIIVNIAEALDYANQRGVVHRDVKPDNILIERESGRAYLADFGIAKQESAATLTRTGMLVGTPLYMSPEQASGDAVIDGRSDLYALGVIAYRMLTGRLPFERGSIQEVLARRLTHDPAPIHTLAPDVPEELSAAVMRCLRRTPSDRWPTGAALRDALVVDANAINVPENLEQLPSMGANLILIVLILWAAVAIGYAWDGDSTWLAMGAVVGALLLMVPGVVVYEAKREGISMRRGLTLAFMAPPKWISWWPKALRRPGDVWERLPKSVRVCRTITMSMFGTSFLVSFPLMITSILWRMGDRSLNPTFKALMPFIIAAPAVVLLAPLAMTAYWARRFRLPHVVAVKLLNEPLVSRFWKRPEVANVLGAPRTAATSAISSPREIARALDVAANAASGQLRQMFQDAARLARDVGGTIDAIDSELRELARDLDPAERHRLEQKLASTAGAQMRELLLSQMHLLDDLERRRVALTERRDRYAQQLQNLWLRAQQLRGQATNTDAADITGAIKSMRQQLDAEAHGVAEVNRLLTVTARRPE
jgi:tRNA A-37 threonylcarbamoyl transferase component Bud32